MELSIRNRTEVTIISFEDYENVKNKKLYLLITRANKKYVLIQNNSVLIMLHHYIIGKPSNDMVIDHINGNELDNRRENLRFATYSINNQNCKKAENATSQYFGVCLVKKQWKAAAFDKYIGMFSTELEAAIAYDIYVIANKSTEYRTNNLIDVNIIGLDVIKEMALNMENNKKKKSTDLPLNITFKRNKFICSIYNINEKKLCYVGAFNKLEEAINARDIRKKEIDDSKPILSTTIIRNKDEIAIVYAYNDKKEIVAEVLLDDDKWVEYSQKCIWLNPDGYATCKVNRIDKPIHKQLLKGDLIDHRNKIRTDNRIENLRISDKSKNGHNKTKDLNSTSKYYGVYFDKNKQQYIAKFSCKGIKYNLSGYKNEILAAWAYNIGVIEIYKEFANTNDINENDIIFEFDKEQKKNQILTYIRNK